MAQCDICGATKNLVNHHRSYEPEVLEVLCNSCHVAVHKHDLAPSRPKDFTPESQSIIPSEQRRKGGIGRGGFLRLLNPRLDYFPVKIKVDRTLLKKAKEQFPETAGLNETDLVEFLLRKALKKETS